MIIGYGRVSTGSQADEGLSPERQAVRLKANGCSEVLFDIESGKNPNRKNYQKLIKLIEQGTVTQVVCIRLDRLGRSSIELCSFYRLCVDKDCDLRILDQGLQLKSPFGKLLYTVLAALAELESDNISARVKDSWAYKREKGLAHRTSFGYKIVDGKFTINPKESAIVREIIDVILNPSSLSEALRYVVTKYPELKWSRTGLQKLVRNPTLRGHLRYKDPITEEDILIKDTHEAILTEGEYSRILSIFEANRWSKSNTRNRPLNVLSGKVVCGVCRKGMALCAGSKKSKYKETYWRNFKCRRSTEGICSNAKSIGYVKLVTSVEKEIQKHAFAIANQINIASVEDDSNQTRITQLRSQLDVLEAIPDSIEYIKESIHKIKQELAALELDSQIKIQTSVSRVEIVKGISHPTFFLSMSDLDKQILFNELLSSVSINLGAVDSIEFTF